MEGAARPRAPHPTTSSEVDAAWGEPTLTVSALLLEAAELLERAADAAAASGRIRLAERHRFAALQVSFYVTADVIA